MPVVQRQQWGKVAEAAWCNLSTFSEAIACPKVNLREGDLDDDAIWLGRKPRCTSTECRLGGFGTAGGILTCSRLENSMQEVEWKISEDVRTRGEEGKMTKLRSQTVPISPDSDLTGKLGTQKMYL